MDASSPTVGGMYIQRSYRRIINISVGNPAGIFYPTDWDAWRDINVLFTSPVLDPARNGYDETFDRYLTEHPGW